MNPIINLNVSVSVDGTVSVSLATETLTFANKIGFPVISPSEVDVKEGVNTEKFIPDPNATATVGATGVTGGQLQP